MSARLPVDRGVFRAGGWHPPEGGWMEARSPADGGVLGLVADADEADVEATVEAALRASDDWADRSPGQRSDALRALAVALRAHRDELAWIDAMEGGNPIRELRADVDVAAARLDAFAGLALEARGQTIPVGGDGLDLTLREPYPVSARILAYNHPLMFAAGAIAAPLAVGSPVILKPAGATVLSACRLAELSVGILPPGVLSVVPGGVRAGAALARHPGVPRLALTGSLATGRRVLREAADHVKHVTLELGGKNAAILYPDADLERAVPAIVAAMNFAWCGQSCGSTSRLFVPAALRDEVVARAAAALARYRPGLPTDEATSMGCLVSRAHRDSVAAAVEEAVVAGARVVVGGRIPAAPDLAAGAFYEATLLVDVPPDARAATQELFGPVLTVFGYDREEDLFEAVHRGPYGLTASVWTRDLATAHRAARRLQVGYVWINSAGAHIPGAPFGGYRQSGLGREGGLGELLSYTQEKNVYVAL